MNKVLSLILAFGLFHNGLLAQETSELGPAEQQELQRLLQERHAEIETEKKSRIQKRFDSISDAIAVSPTNTEIRKNQIFEQEVARAEELLKASHTDEELKRLARHSLQERDAAQRDSQMRGYTRSAVVGGTGAGLLIWAYEDARKEIENLVSYVNRDSDVKKLQKQFSLLQTEHLAYQGDHLVEINRQKKILNSTLPPTEKMLELLPENVVREYNLASKNFDFVAGFEQGIEKKSPAYDASWKRLKAAKRDLDKARKVKLREVKDVYRSMVTAGPNRAKYVADEVVKVEKQLGAARQAAVKSYNDGIPKLVKKTRVGAKIVGAGLVLYFGNGLLAKWTGEMDRPNLDEKLSLQNLRRHFSKEKNGYQC